ncbi:MAG: septum formation family protein [Corynebacterium sp.]|uniref:septum formation family protein n=1 Tax=Corynebacterium sp. TaxID=1720 RepID=UPI0026DB7EF3|nr:septum formation family protein [Corynebacterium sp.]MDO5029972.1 septum formation family protein [Corynebacterium sp.]
MAVNNLKQGRDSAADTATQSGGGSGSGSGSSRGSWGLRAFSTAMLVGAAGMAFALQAGVIEAPAGATGAHGSVKNSASSPTSTTVIDKETAAFTNAARGDCLDWNLAEDLNISDFRVVPCAEPHAYEVAKKLQLTDFEEHPGQYSKTAAYPTQDNLIALQNGVCRDTVTEYLQGKYDPHGRFITAPIIPSPSQWQKGDRALMCGIQVVDENGATTHINGPAAGQDQARVFEPGRCVTVDEQGAINQVPCTEDHVMESTGIINLRDHFGDNVPTDQEQNDVLAEQCVLRAQEYLGGDDNLYNSTLMPFWTSLPQESLDAGSRNVNCWLIKDNGQGGFSTLNGHANESFTIDGQPPVAPPPRNPLREDQADPNAGAGAGAGAGADAAGGSAAPADPAAPDAPVAGQ